MRHCRTREQGLTFISLAVILMVIGFFTMLVLKIGPIYMNHSKVLNALYAVEETEDVEQKSRKQVYSMLAKRFDLNYVDNVTKEDITVTKGGGYLKVQIAYEIVEPIMGNLSVLVDFDDVIEVGDQ